MRVNPTDNLHILTGTRYSHWKRDWSWDYDLSDGKPDTRAVREQRTEKSRFVPYLGITYDLDPNNSLYASYTSIFKYNTNPGKNGQPLPATLGNNYEVGWKGEWYNGDLNASVAFFQIDQKNTAINSRQRLTDGTNRFYFEPMTLQSRGLDAEISGKLTDQWQMLAGLHLQHPQIHRNHRQHPQGQRLQQTDAETHAAPLHQLPPAGHGRKMDGRPRHEHTKRHQ